MMTNELPVFDQTDNETGCCPRFDPEPWKGQTLHFVNKRFVRASTISLFHVPLNMGHVFARTSEAIKDSHADHGGFAVLSHDTSSWHAEHLFSVDRDVPGAEMVRLSGDFLTKVFDGPFSETPKWEATMKDYVQSKGRQLDTLYFFYTTCPRCAKHYGKNYVVGIAKLANAG